MLICAFKNYLILIIIDTKWCPYLCPSVFEWHLLVDLPIFEQLFQMQEWLHATSRDLTGHIFTDQWGIFSTLIVTPIVEEAIYRGPMYLTRRSSKGFWWWFTGLTLVVVFALSHGRSGIALVPVLALGSYNLWLVAVTQRFWPAVSLHFLYNFIFLSLVIYQSVWASD